MFSETSPVPEVPSVYNTIWKGEHSTEFREGTTFVLFYIFSFVSPVAWTICCVQLGVVELNVERSYCESHKENNQWFIIDIELKRM